MTNDAIPAGQDPVVPGVENDPGGRGVTLQLVACGDGHHVVEAVEGGDCHDLVGLVLDDATVTVGVWDADGVWQILARLDLPVGDGSRGPSGGR